MAPRRDVPTTPENGVDMMAIIQTMHAMATAMTQQATVTTQQAQT